MRWRARAATVVSMTNLTVSERRRLTAIRASWLFDGIGSVLIANPLVVFDGAAIRSAESGGAAIGHLKLSQRRRDSRRCGWR
jgi:hypothetical protein